jgi:hypothetical protein
VILSNSTPLTVKHVLQREVSQSADANVGGYIVRSALLAIAITACSSAFGWQTPREAIDQFLAYELDGGRLIGWNWHTYTTKYIAAPLNYEEPGWDEITLVKSWAVSPPVCSSKNSCIAQIRLSLAPTVGLNDPNVVPHYAGGEEVLSFNLVRNRRGWFVAPEMPSPRVLEATYLRFRNQ